MGTMPSGSTLGETLRALDEHDKERGGGSGCPRCAEFDALSAHHDHHHDQELLDDEERRVLGRELREARALAWETAKRLFSERELSAAIVDRHDAIAAAHAQACRERDLIRLDACRLFQEQQEYRRIPSPTTSPEHVFCADCGHPLAHHAIDEDRPGDDRMVCEDGGCACREFAWRKEASA